MDSKELYTSAVLETPLGALMVQDRDDRKRDELIKSIRESISSETDIKKIKRNSYLLQALQSGRFRMPGGPVSEQDRQTVGIGEEINIQNLSSISPEHLEAIRESVVRNINAELNLTVKRSTVTPIMDFQGEGKAHVICFAKAEGQIDTSRQGIIGIGFLDKPPALPVSRTFLTESALHIYENYISSPQRSLLIPRHESKISVSWELIDEWYMSMYRAYLSLSKSKRKEVRVPARPVSTPNLRIFHK
jgi:hypothetical protein